MMIFHSLKLGGIRHAKLGCQALDVHRPLPVEQVAELASQQVLQPMHVSAALSHLAKLHAMGLTPRQMERFRASGLVQRLAGESTLCRAQGLLRPRLRHDYVMIESNAHLKYSEAELLGPAVKWPRVIRSG